MLRNASFALLSLLALTLPLAAQTEISLHSPEGASMLTLDQPDMFGSADSATLIHDLPLLGLLDGRRFPISTELGRMSVMPVNLFPIAYLNADVKPKTSARSTEPDTSKESVAMRAKRSYTTSGEFGVLYGRAIGKHGGSDVETYITGTIATDNVSITVGASHEELSGHFLRDGRDAGFLAH